MGSRAKLGEALSAVPRTDGLQVSSRAEAVAADVADDGKIVSGHALVAVMQGLDEVTLQIVAQLMHVNMLESAISSHRRCHGQT